MGVGELIKARRKAAGLTQAELARLVPGLGRSGLSAIENGATKTVAPDVANELVKVLPLSMPELLRAMGFNLPAVHTSLDESLLRDLESAPPELIEVVRLLLAGWRSQRVPKPARGGE